MCARAFNIRADLKRHERAVHKAEQIRGQDGKVLKCANEGCKAANKV
jgi:hypothetical protein